MIRRAFVALWGFTAALLALASILKAGPSIEGRFFPVRTGNRMEAIERTAERLCFTWASDKLRMARSDNVDTFIDALAPDHAVRNTFVVSVINTETGQPWQSGRVMPLGSHPIRYCAAMPSAIGPAEPIRFRMTIWYHGWHDLWPLPLELPDIVSPAAGDQPP